MPYHLLLDHAGEAKLGKLQIGTTQRGIGPCYADKAARLGIRVQDLLDEKILKKKITAALEPKRLSLRPFARGPVAGPAVDDRGVPDLRPPPRAAHRRHRAARLGRARRRQARPLRGRPGRAAGHRPRHLSVRHLLEPDRGRGLRRRGRRAAGHPRGLGHREGLRHARRRRPVPDRAARRGRRGDPPPRRRVRHDDRPRAAHRLARHRRAALRRAHQRADGAGDHEARRAHGLREDQGLHALPRRRRRRRSTTSPTTSRSCTTPRGEYIELPAGARTSPSAAARATCPGRARLPRLHRRGDRGADRARRRRPGPRADHLGQGEALPSAPQTSRAA